MQADLYISLIWMCKECDIKMSLFLQLAGLNAAEQSGLIAFVLGAFLVVFLLVLVVYLYMAFALYAMAKKLSIENPWLAFIPIGNLVLMANMAEMHWWPILLLIGSLFPFIGFAFSIAFIVFWVMWWLKIIPKLGKPDWWVVLLFVPIVNFVIYGILAWGDSGGVTPIRKVNKKKK